MTALEFFTRYAINGRAFLRPITREDERGQPPKDYKPGTWLVRVGDRLLLCRDTEGGHVVRFVCDTEPIVLRKVHS